MNAKQFKTRLKTILAHNAIPRPFEREKAGLINSKRLGLALTTDRVFKKRSEEKLEKKYSIEILIDASGSMWRNGKRERAREVAGELAKILSQLKGVEFEVSEFSGTDLILKEFEAPYSPKQTEAYGQKVSNYQLYSNGHDIFDVPDSVPSETLGSMGYRLDSRAGYSSDNHDALAVWRAYQRLMERKDSKKILVVLSDGQPTREYDFKRLADTHKSVRGDRYSVELMRDYPADALRKATTKIKKEKKVIMLGVGIQSRAVEDYYPDYVVVRSLATFFSGIASLLAKQIKKV